MHSFHLQSLICILSLVERISADCRSTGTDFIDGGGPYCINTTSAEYFSFGSEFDGCATSDAQDGVVTPILIDPNTDEYFCSNIPVVPNDVNQISTCNVPGEELTKNNMISGTWIVVVEGLTFAWMRSFNIIAGPPVTVTSTPTATFSMTSTPSTTATTTSTLVITTNLPPVTVTVPSTTRTFTSTITPRPVTTTITSLNTLTITRWAFARTVQTVTTTKQCFTARGPFDPQCTIRPTKASLAAATVQGTPISKSQSWQSRSNPWRSHHRSQRDRSWAVSVRHEAAARGLLDFDERGADVCTTTVVQTTNLPSTTITVTAPVSTIMVTVDVTSTATITPPPITTITGKASTTTTITKPTQTMTKISRGFTLTTSTKTIWATITSVVKATPSGVVCIDNGGF